MSERITAEQVQSDVESYALRASPDGRRRVIMEALDRARREGGEDAQAEVARLRKLFDDAGQGEHNVLALVDHYQADAMRMSAEVARLREALAASEARAEKLLSRVVATAECGCARRQAALERVEPAPSLCSKSDRCSFCRAAALVRELGGAGQ